MITADLKIAVKSPHSSQRQQRIIPDRKLSEAEIEARILHAKSVSKGDDIGLQYERRAAYSAGERKPQCAIPDMM
jgi:hypothetical protein